MVSGTMILQATINIIPSAMWIASIYLPLPRRLGLIWVTIFFDLCGSIVALALVRNAKRFPRAFQHWFEKTFEFYPAINIEHKTERTNAFATLVFGYSVVAIIYQNAASFGLNAFFGKAVLGLLQAFCFNWIYFELDGADLYTHAIRRSAFACTSPSTPFSRLSTKQLTQPSYSLGLLPPPLHHVLRPSRRRAL